MSILLKHAAVIALGLSLLGCEAGKEKVATQVVAKVNNTEISVHQVNYVLQRTSGVTAQTSEAASVQILERLIGQELAVQKAHELKLDRTPATVQALDAARREVLARAYIESLTDDIAKPTQEDVAAFYAQKPALFSNRKIYTFQEVSILGTAPQMIELQRELAGSRSVQEFADHLKASGLEHSARLLTQPAENLPLELLDRVAGMSVGQTLLVPQTGGVKALLLASASAEPVDQATATPVIEKFLLNDRKRLKTDENMKALRASAKVEFLGKYAQASGPAASGATAATADVAASELSADSVRKGLSGFR